jgi:hypothetical protein
VLSKFANGWQYNDINGTLTGKKGDILYKLYYVDDCVNIYKTANANRTLWNPTDVTTKITHSYFIEDGSFLRLNTLTLGYTLPNELVKRVGISNLRFYTTAYNVFCITSYSGYDPEVSTMRRTNLTPGVDYSAYPKSRQFVVGLNLNF